MNNLITFIQKVMDMANRVGNDVQTILANIGTLTSLNTTNKDNLVDATNEVNTKVDNFIATKGQANGLASLGGDGKVPASQLPAFVDDVIEVANFAALPATGETSKIYITLDNNLTYRWSGSVYVEISESLALGETSSTAYRGDRGKIAYDHTFLTNNPHSVTKAQVGLGSVQNYGIATQAEAEGDLVNNKYMTPLRVSQQVDQAIASVTPNDPDAAYITSRDT